MRKLISVLLAGVLVIGVFAGCGKQATEPLVEETTSVEESSEAESSAEPSTTPSKVVASSKSASSSKTPAPSSTALSSVSLTPSSQTPPTNNYPKTESEFLVAIKSKVNTSGYTLSSTTSSLSAVDGTYKPTAVAKFKSVRTGYTIYVHCFKSF